MSIAEELNLLTVLDSPLLDQFAPELLVFRSKLREITSEQPTGGCTPCQQKALLGKLVTLQVELNEVIIKEQALVDMVPQLLETAKK